MSHLPITSIERFLKQNEKSFWYDQIKGEKKSCLQEGFFFFLLGNDNEKKKVPEVFLRSFADIVCQWESFVPH